MNNFEKRFGNLAENIEPSSEGELFDLDSNIYLAEKNISKDYKKRITVGFNQLSELSQEEKDIIEDKIVSFIKKTLEKNGILEQINNFDVFDFDNFDIGNYLKNIDKKVYIGRAIKSLNFQDVALSKQNIFNILNKILVVSKSEFHKNPDNPQKRNIIETPNSAEDLFRIEKLKEFGFDENKSNSFYFNLDEEIVAKNGDIISVFEIRAFQRIFGKFKARRSEKGELLIWDQSKNKYVKFNLTAIRNNESSRVVFNTQNLLNRCPNLFKLNILKIEDFYINTQQYSGELIRKEFEYKSKGAFYVSMDSAKYYIGRDKFVYKSKDGVLDERDFKDIRVVVLDDKNAGIVESIGGSEVLKYTFELISEDEKEFLRQEVLRKFPNLSVKQANARITVNKDRMNELIRKWDITKENPPKQGESQENYYKRISTIGNYGFISRIGREFLENSNIGIHNLSWKEQQWFCSAYYELDKNRNKLFGFAKNYVFDGLRTFLSCEHDPQNSKIILEIGELLDKKVLDENFRKNIFEKYANTISLVDEIVENARSFFQKYDKQDFNERELRTKLLEASSDQLNNLYLKLLEEKTEYELKISIEEILNDFDNISKQKLQILELLKISLDDLEKIEKTYGTDDVNEGKKDILIQNAKEKIINLLFERENVVLPKNFREGVSREIFDYSPEIPDTDKNVYLPVGITSRPIEGIEKPIDSLAYIFWLNNQKKDSELVIVDSIQKTNYEVLYNNGLTFPIGFIGRDPKTVAEEMGSRDKQFYNTYKEAFDLGIDISKYPKEHDLSFSEELKYLNDLNKNNNGVAKTFNSIVEESVIKKAKEANPGLSEQELISKLSEYAKEEVAIILSKNGLKISHEKEFRYDVLAKILSVYKLLEQNKESVIRLLKNSHNKEYGIENHLMNLAAYISYLDDEKYRDCLVEINNFSLAANGIEREIKKINLSNFDLENGIQLKIREKNRQSNFIERNNIIDSQIETKRSKISSNNNLLAELTVKLDLLYKQLSDAKDELQKYLDSNPELSNVNRYLNRFYKSKLFNISQDRIASEYLDCGEKIKTQNWFDTSNIPEFYYPTSITGMSFELKSEEQEEKSGFREFYSSYVGNRQDWIYSNQVLANPEASIAKFSVLSSKLQIEYFEKVIKPILINYYIATSDNKDEAKNRFLKDFKNINSPIDALLFIQKNIVNKAYNS
ncbi:MAG: hypothetical protein PHH83_01020 [Patescibacteria group bacterium]|nr:hypothetical protein [Patescibacteria group bacterium]